jgi:Sulfotransferase family
MRARLIIFLFRVVAFVERGCCDCQHYFVAVAMKLTLHHHHRQPQSRRKLAPLVMRLVAIGSCLTLLYFFLTLWHWRWSLSPHLRVPRTTNQPPPQLYSTTTIFNPPMRDAHHQPKKEDDEQEAAEIQAARVYVDSFRQLGQNLAFFHIPKTAGTAVEQAAGKQKLTWGSCAFPHRPKRTICHYPNKKDANNSQMKDWPPHIGWWHLPPFLFPIVQRNDKDHKAPLVLVNPYANTELFGIVRDPYERIVSEFHYICTLKVLSWRPDQCDRQRLDDPAYMNEWIRQKLQNNNRDETLQSQEKKDHPSDHYRQDNGHFTSQYDFVFGPHQVRMLDYVLRMEDLHDSFPRLMVAFHDDNDPHHQLLRLEHHNAIGAAQRTDKGLTTLALEAATVQEILRLYRNDFVIGRYSEEITVQGTSRT